MKKFLVSMAGGAILLTVLPAQSNATSMVATWEATVGTVNGTLAQSIWNIGDTIQFQVTYDDEGTNYHEYSDGANGIAELGRGDDTIEQTITLPSSSDYYFYSDAGFTFDQNTLDFIAQVDDSGVRNDAETYQNDEYLFSYYSADSFGASLWSSEIAYSYMAGLVFDANGMRVYNRVYFSDLTYTVAAASQDPAAPVPEPATMLLFGTGLVGFAGYKKRQSKRK